MEGPRPTEQIVLTNEERGKHGQDDHVLEVHLGLGRVGLMRLGSSRRQMIEQGLALIEAAVATRTIDLNDFVMSRPDPPEEV